MQATLDELERQEKLILPGPSSWGGSYSGMDEFYNGDESKLIFLRASGGNTEADSRNIILTCLFSNHELESRIRDLSEDVDKDKLLNALNSLSGRQLPQVFSSAVEYC